MEKPKPKQKAKKLFSTVSFLGISELENNYLCDLV